MQLNGSPERSVCSDVFFNSRSVEVFAMVTSTAQLSVNATSIDSPVKFALRFLEQLALQRLVLLQSPQSASEESISQKHCHVLRRIQAPIPEKVYAVGRVSQIRAEKLLTFLTSACMPMQMNPCKCSSCYTLTLCTPLATEGFFKIVGVDCSDCESLNSYHFPEPSLMYLSRTVRWVCNATVWALTYEIMAHACSAGMN